MEVFPCPLCASDSTENRYRIEIPKLGERRVEECLACGFHFVAPRPAETELKEFYSADYFEENNSAHGYADYFHKSHARRGDGYIFGRRLRRWKTSGRVLELGCGTGEFLAGVREASGWEPTGLDLSAHAIESARAANAGAGIRFMSGDLSSAGLPEGSFDAVVARDVIEHLRDPAATLRAVRRLLVPGGRLWMQVPNGHTELAPFARANRQGEPGREGQAHLNYFPPVVLRGWLEESGWEVERIYTVGMKRGLFSLGFLPGWLKTSRWRSARRRPPGPIAKPHRASKWKESRVYAYLRRGIKYSLKLPLFLPLGQELHVVARKTARNLPTGE